MRLTDKDRFNSLDDIAWYASAYMLTTGCFQLLFGRLYATFSTKWVFIGAISVFEIGSLLCAATPSSIGLSKFRFTRYQQVYLEANVL